MVKSIYRISEAAALLGVDPSTLRRWDSDGLVECFRTPGNQRRISAEEIRRLKCLRKKESRTMI